MRAGRLRHRVTFQRATITDDSYGEPDQSWADLDTVWGSVEPLTGNERYSAMQTQSEVDYLIVCRYNSTIASLAPNDRATWNSLIFDIKSVINPDGRNIELKVFAKRHI